jgi:hypothetical protein
MNLLPLEGTTDHVDHKIALTRPYIFIMLRTADSYPQPAGHSEHTDRHLSEHRHSRGVDGIRRKILRIFQNRYAGGGPAGQSSRKRLEHSETFKTLEQRSHLSRNNKNRKERR